MQYVAFRSKQIAAGAPPRSGRLPVCTEASAPGRGVGFVHRANEAAEKPADGLAALNTGAFHVVVQTA